MISISHLFYELVLNTSMKWFWLAVLQRWMKSSAQTLLQQRLVSGRKKKVGKRQSKVKFVLSVNMEKKSLVSICTVYQVIEHKCQKYWQKCNNFQWHFKRLRSGIKSTSSSPLSWFKQGERQWYKTSLRSQGISVTHFTIQLLPFK